jgi:hypothetical protein
MNKLQASSRRLPALSLLSVFCILCGFSTSSQAAFTKLGMSGAQFLKIGVGRPTGMGDAFVAVADDASATYWNPAGIALIDKNEFLFNHIDWISDINHEYVAFVAPTTAGNFGFAVTALTMGDIEETTIDEEQGTGRTFTASDLCLGITYARRFSDKFSFGASAKVMQEQVWDMVSPGVAFDFGVHYNTGWRSLRLGMAISNFGPDVRFSGKQLQFDYDPAWEWPWTRTPLAGELLTETYPLPVLFRFGAAYDVLDTKNMRLTAAADLVHYNDVNEKVNLGLEYNIYGFKLRGGYVLNTDAAYADELGWSSGLSAGAGIALRPFSRLNLELDYGYRNLARLGASHRLNIGVRF